MAPTVSAEFFMKVRRVMSFEDGSDEFLVVCDEFISKEFVLATGGGVRQDFSYSRLTFVYLLPGRERAACGGGEFVLEKLTSR